MIVAAGCGLSVRVFVPTRPVPEVNYVVALFEFEDLNHSRAVPEIRRAAVDEVQAYYDEVSYGKIRVKGTIIERWIRIPIKVKELDLFHYNYDRDHMLRVDVRTSAIIDELIGDAQYGIRFAVYAGQIWGHAREENRTAFVSESRGASVYAHELGHLLGLPDLYSYELASEGRYPNIYLGQWDLMSASWLLVHFCSWSKLRLGWINEEQVVDVTQKHERPFIIDAIENKSAKILLVRVPLSENEAYYIEVRARLGLDARVDRFMRMGVLILLVNEALSPENGKVAVIDSHPNSARTAPQMELFDAPFSIGRGEVVAYTDRTRNLSIIVLAKIGHSYKIMLGDAATGNKAIEANTIILKAEDAVAKAEREQRLKGLGEARSQLVKAKADYNESRFPDAITSAKAAIDLADAATGTTSESITATPTMATTSRAAETTATPSPSPSAVAPTTMALAILIAAGAFIILRKSKKKIPM